MSRQRPYIPDIPEERKQEIIDLLIGKGVEFAPCPVCKYDHPAILSGVEIYEMNTHDNLIIPREPNVIGSPPAKRNWKAAAVICKNCGYRLEFDLSFLG